MAKKRASDNAPKQAARQPRKKKAAEPESRGLPASEVATGLPSKEVEEVRWAIEKQGYWTIHRVSEGVNGGV